jgi:hypothetical protein
MKKVIFVTFCLILFLIFTALSYGDIDPKYKFRGDPWDHMLSPRVPGDRTVQLEVNVVLISFNFNAPMMICVNKELFLNKEIGHSSSIPDEKKWTNRSKNLPKR